MLSWGAVVINGILAWLFIAMFLEYQYYIFGIAAAVGIPALPGQFLQMITPAVVYTIVTAGSILYALSVDNTPQRLFKGLAIAGIAIAIEESFARIAYLSALYDTLKYFFQAVAMWVTNAAALPFGAGAVAIIPTLLLLNGLDIPGKVLTGMLLAFTPYILAIVWYLYDNFVGEPFFKAGLKLVGIVAKRAQLGFLMPFAVYLLTITSFILAMPVWIFVLGWTLSIIIWIYIKYAIGSLAAFILDAVFYLIGIVVGSTLGGWMYRLVNLISRRAMIYSAPVVFFIAAIFGMAPIVFTLMYAISMTPVVALLAGIMLVVSPVIRRSTEVVVNTFTMLFVLSTVLTIVGVFSGVGMGALTTCLLGAGPSAATNMPLIDPTQPFTSLAKCGVCYASAAVSSNMINATKFETCMYGVPISQAAYNNRIVPNSYYWPSQQ